MQTLIYQSRPCAWLLCSISTFQLENLAFRSQTELHCHHGSQQHIAQSSQRGKPKFVYGSTNNFRSLTCFSTSFAAATNRITLSPFDCALLESSLKFRENSTIFFFVKFDFAVSFLFGSSGIDDFDVTFWRWFTNVITLWSWVSYIDLITSA